MNLVLFSNAVKCASAYCTCLVMKAFVLFSDAKYKFYGARNQSSLFTMITFSSLVSARELLRTHSQVRSLALNWLVSVVLLKECNAVWDSEEWKHEYDDKRAQTDCHVMAREYYNIVREFVSCRLSRVNSSIKAPEALLQPNLQRLTKRTPCLPCHFNVVTRQSPPFFIPAWSDWVDAWYLNVKVDLQHRKGDSSFTNVANGDLGSIRWGR